MNTVMPQFNIHVLIKTLMSQFNIHVFFYMLHIGLLHAQSNSESDTQNKFAQLARVVKRINTSAVIVRVQTQSAIG